MERVVKMRHGMVVKPWRHILRDWWHSRRPVSRRLMAELKAAYAELDAKPYEDDPDGNAQAIGRYEGLKRAYVLLTGRSVQDVANEVVTWYVRTPEYQAAKKHYADTACSPKRT